MAKFLTILDAKQTVIIDKTQKPEAADEMLLKIYMERGYTVRYKSEARAKAMKRKSDGLNEEKILKLCEGKPELIEKYNQVKATKGFISAKEMVKEELGMKEKKEAKAAKGKK